MNNWISLVRVALCLIVCMYNLLHGRVTQYEHSVDGGRKRERGCVDRAEFFSTVASISSQYDADRDCLQEFRHVYQHQHVNRVTGAVASSLSAFSPRSRECGPDSRDGGLSKGLIRSDCLAPWSVPMSVRSFLSAQPENTSTDGKFVCCRWDLRPLNLAIGS